MNEKPVIVREFDELEEALEFVRAIEKARLIWRLIATELDEYTVEIFADITCDEESE